MREGEGEEATEGGTERDLSAGLTLGLRCSSTADKERVTRHLVRFLSWQWYVSTEICPTSLLRASAADRRIFPALPLPSATQPDRISSLVRLPSSEPGL
jgi:hypothetical protein